MATNYPDAIDTYAAKVDGVTDVMASHINDLQDAVEAIETELGTDPAGSFTDVKTRLLNHPLNKLDAITAPTVNEDSDDGYGVGSVWCDVTNDRAYRCLDATVGAAIWQNVTSKTGTWVPVLTQGVGVTYTTSWAVYQISGRTVHIECILGVTSAGTAANPIVISGIPAALAIPFGGSQAFPVGVGVIVDYGTVVYQGIIRDNISTTAVVVFDSVTQAIIGVNPNFALANTDIICLNMTYQLA
jgi:hypothetical protein